VSTAEELKAPSNYKNADKIAEYIEASKRKLIDDADTHPVAGVVKKAAVIVGHDDMVVMHNIGNVVAYLNDVYKACSGIMVVAARHVTARIRQLAFQAPFNIESSLYPAFVSSVVRAHSNLVLLDPLFELISGSKISAETVIDQFDVHPDLPDGDDKVAERGVIMVQALCQQLGITGDEAEV